MEQSQTPPDVNVLHSRALAGSECKLSTSGHGQRCAALRKVGGTNDMTVSNRAIPIYSSSMLDPSLVPTSS